MHDLADELEIPEPLERLGGWQVAARPKRQRQKKRDAKV